MKSIYCTPFVFKASRYEEYQDGKCIGKGNVAIQIISKTKDNCAMFHLEGELPIHIKRNFGIPIYGIKCGDILEDRIQYGRLPDLKWDDPTDPVVCNIFANKTCIRFALMNPLRIIEFFGDFELIGDVKIGINMGRKCPWTRNELLHLYNRLEAYTKALTLRLLQEEGEKSSMEAYAAYNIFKYPVVYVYIHYHYGRFEDFCMKEVDVSSYMTMYMIMVREITQGILEGLQTSDVFYYDNSKELSALLEDVCEEVLLILDS